MMAREDHIGMAMNLMCLALVCLDEASEREASEQLQKAIDALREASIFKPGKTFPDEMADT